MVFTPLAHPLFTALTGIGLGLAVRTASRRRAVLMGSGGLAAAMVLHHLWNRGARTGTLGTLYLALFAPTLVVLVIVAVAAGRRERKVLADELAGEIERGVITSQEYLEWVDPRRRRRRVWRALLRDGPRAAARVFQLDDLVSDLAFEKARRAGPLELDAYRAAIRLVRGKTSSRT